MEERMNRQARQRLVSLAGAALALASMLGGCVGTGAGGAFRGPLAATGDAAAAPDPEAKARAAAVAEMRAAAEAASEQPYPSVYQVERNRTLAARPEPRSVEEVAAIEAELALLAEQRSVTADPAEIAALDARAQELRRLFAAAQAGEVRR